MNDLSEIFDKHKKSVVTFIDGVRNEAYKQGCIDAIEKYKNILVAMIETSGEPIGISDLLMVANKLKEKK